MLTPTSKVPSSAIYAFANLVGFDQYDLLLVESVLTTATMEEFLNATYNVGRLKNQTLASKVINVSWETADDDTRITFALASDGDMYRELLIDSKLNITKTILVRDTKPDWHQEIKVFNADGFLLSGENSDNEGCNREIVYRSLETDDRGYIEGEWNYYTDGQLTETEVSVMANSNKDDSEFHVYARGQLARRVIVNNHNKAMKYQVDSEFNMDIIYDVDGDPLHITEPGKSSIISWATVGVHKMPCSLTVHTLDTSDVRHYAYDFGIKDGRPVKAAVYVGQSYDNRINKIALNV